jgi:hypothetical protein
MPTLIDDMKKLTDIKTKQSTAFYACLGMTLWDVKTRGLNWINGGLLAALAGIGLLGGAGHAFSLGGPPEPPGGAPPAP